MRIAEGHHKEVQSIPKGKAGGGKRRSRLLLLESGRLISCGLGAKADASKEYRQAKDRSHNKKEALQLAEERLREALAVSGENVIVRQL